ncbi:ATP-dependent nuclease [Vibrio coralliilyticus]|uniref:ATP-dependent nuclease n=1 Tax=Vibrio coralliilyticus TaxID=190893 RepID=UPI000C172DB3|nr:ATP-binding protein [Vibrio coralliilyticus]
MKLSGFAFSGYRSFGGEKAVIAPLKKINFLIGANNSGKSNVMRLLCEQTKIFTEHKHSLSSFDQPQLGNQQLSVSIALDREQTEDFASIVVNRAQTNEQRLTYIKWLLDKCIPKGQEGYTWFNISLNGVHTKNDIVEKAEAIEFGRQSGINWTHLAGSLGTFYSNQTRDRELVLEQLALWKPKLSFKTEFIPAIRKVGAAGSKASDFSGEGIIERLAMLERPKITEQEDKKKFDKINSFLKSVLENESAQIEIPHDFSMIIVHMDGKSLPLESLGTGVHEVIILAAAATLLEDTIVCIEEPELHLHPILQRKLIGYLSENTDNQYFITTHSAHLLDATEAQIFHVTMKEGISSVSAVTNTRERSELCAELGYKASDILQANCVIWVEGPSDRTYLNYWIKARDEELTEGIHYSIMFYGGRLASHISGFDPHELEEHEKELISLRQLNRNSVIMIDSDKESPHKPINSTKKRLQREFDKGPGFAWITSGREVENYLDEDKVEEAVLAVHSDTAKELVEKGKWANLLNYQRNKPLKRKGKETVLVNAANKVKVANYYTENNAADLSKYDLNKKLTELVSFIRSANGIEI